MIAALILAAVASAALPVIVFVLWWADPNRPRNGMRCQYEIDMRIEQVAHDSGRCEPGCRVWPCWTPGSHAGIVVGMTKREDDKMNVSETDPPLDEYDRKVEARWTKEANAKTGTDGQRTGEVNKSHRDDGGNHRI